MFCQKCGAYLPDNTRFCANCGSPISVSAQPAQPVQLAMPAQSPQPAQPVQPSGAQAAQNPQGAPQYNAPPVGGQYYQDSGQQYYVPPVQPANGTTWKEICQRGYIIGKDGKQYNIGWMKFVVNVQLILGAVLMLYSGLTFVTGLVYGSDKELMYTLMPKLQGVEIAYGILLILLAAALVVTRFMFTRLKRCALPMYVVSYSIYSISFIAYLYIGGSLVYEVTKTVPDFGQDIASVATSIALIIINVNYFRRRYSVFTN